MKTLASNYRLSKDDPHYKIRRKEIIKLPFKWITKTYIESCNRRYLINLRCKDRFMKIVQLDYKNGSDNPKRKIMAVSEGDPRYKEFYSCYKIARKSKDDELVYNVLLH